MDEISSTTPSSAISAWVSRLKPRSKPRSTLEKHMQRGGRTELHQAAIQNDDREISRLLSKHIPLTRRLSNFTLSVVDNPWNVNAQDILGRSALHWAVATENEECARQLMMHPTTNRLLKDHDGKTPLHEAATRGYDDIVHNLLENEEIRCDINSGDNCGRTALHWAAEKTQLRWSAEKTLLRWGKKDYYERIVQLLLEQGADVSREDNCHHTALHRAALRGHLDMTMLLIEGGAKVSAAVFRLAVEGNQREIGRLLFFTTNFEKEDTPTVPEHWLRLFTDPDPFDGRPPLRRAIEQGHAGIVKQLLTNGNVDVNSKVACDRFGEKPLVLAVRWGHTAIVQHLLATEKVDTDSRDNNGRTPLSFAARRGSTDIVQQLLATGKVDTDSRDSDGRTPLSFAAEEGSTDVVQQLLATGKVDTDSRDSRGRTPLMWASDNEHSAVVHQLQGYQGVASIG